MDWTHRLRLRNLQVLVSLAETGNISHSALQLNTTQPGLSKWLKELESDVGLPLFERLPRGLRLTAYGETLLTHARRIEAEVDRARDQMESLRAGSSGQVVIGTSGAAASETVPAAVLALLRDMPQAHVRIVEATMDRLMTQLERGELDVVVGRAAAEYVDSRLQSEQLYAEPLRFVVREGHPLKSRRGLAWPELLAYRWLLWPKGTPIRAALDAALERAGHSAPADHLESNSLTASLSLLAESDMIGLTSDRVVTRYERLGILRRLPLRFDAFGTVAMYWRRDIFRPAAVDAALACLRETASPRSGGQRRRA